MDTQTAAKPAVSETSPATKPPAKKTAATRSTPKPPTSEKKAAAKTAATKKPATKATAPKTKTTAPKTKTTAAKTKTTAAKTKTTAGRTKTPAAERTAREKTAADKAAAPKTAAKRTAPRKTAGAGRAAASGHRGEDAPGSVPTAATAREAGKTAARGTKKTRAQPNAQAPASAVRRTRAATEAATEAVPPTESPGGEPTVGPPSSVATDVTGEQERWTADELAAVRATLEAQAAQYRQEIEQAESVRADVQRESADGAGDDTADTGTKTFEREQEISLANNRLDLLNQVRHALDRLDRGTYGRCESCDRPIAKPRVQAFPSATLCRECKQREERR
ncbi:MAG TPA: TraR/DksA C4-type zinc finger protein [Mycobacteriales bacterium]|nr:TraR/DksA C4-type zinc finger protein [Mycobacteriales bacterium]